MRETSEAGLSGGEIERFVTEGFVRVAGAFPRDVADECRALLWREIGKDPDDPSGWTEPVVRVMAMTDPPFVRAVNSPRLRRTYDQLAGPGAWVEPLWLGTFPIRFPHGDDPGDCGWHIDAGWHIREDGIEDVSEEGEPSGVDLSGFRVSLRSRGRALLMLFLLSDVGEEDAPTLVRVGSHLDVPPLLEPYGDEGANLIGPDAETAHRPVVAATGRAGDVYLCHPFLVHSAQPHRGVRPKFMAQPPLVPTGLLELERAEGSYTPVERAVRVGLGRSGS